MQAACEDQQWREHQEGHVPLQGHRRSQSCPDVERTGRLEEQ